MMKNVQKVYYEKIKIGKNFSMGKRCDINAQAFMTEFKGKHRVIIPSLKGVIIGDNVFLGSGVIIVSGVYRATYIGDYSYIWHNAMIGHDSHISNDVAISSGCMIGGICEIDSYTFLGLGCILSPRVKIGIGCMLGANSNVIHDTIIPDGEIWYGNPAKFIKKNEWKIPI